MLCRCRKMSEAAHCSTVYRKHGSVCDFLTDHRSVGDVFLTKFYLTKGEKTMKSKKLVAMCMAVLLGISAVLPMAGCTKKTKYTVGVCQLTQHLALDAATQGFEDALKSLLGAENVEIDVQKAAGDSTACTTIANAFVSKKVDLIMANATAALQAAYNATSEIPILGTSITEYGTALGLSDFNGTVGGNVSGTSDLAPLTEQGDMILELFPQTQKVGLLYCSAEPNSEYQVRVMESYLAGKNVQTTRFSFSDSNDIATVVANAANNSDVIYIPTDNTAAACTGTIANVVREKKVPVIAGEQGICSGCGVAALSISYYDLGYKTGEMAAKILKGEANISEMPIEYAPAKKLYNAEICRELGVTVPEGYEAITE